MTRACKPSAFINASGGVVGAALKYLNGFVAAKLVVIDDMSLRLEEMRLREKGCADRYDASKSIQ